jgi:KUP system potassium uptake protein
MIRLGALKKSKVLSASSIRAYVEARTQQAGSEEHVFQIGKTGNERHNKPLGILTLSALGIVFGDIGTSPLYALKTVIELSGGHPTHDSALGLLSLIIWTLLIITSLKYVTFVMRIDNDGEGGILALMALLKRQKHHRPLMIALGLLGAALIYGDGAITPAISVLSAVEGLKTPVPNVAPYIVLISVIILLVLFAMQHHGTATIGWVFGPIMALWFCVIGILGLQGIAQYPHVLVALNPWYGIHYLLINGRTGFFVLGGVFLVVTGAEALYADMGHLGAKPIRLAWYGLVLPALFLNYTGQTATLVADNTIDGNVFYNLCPPSLLIPLIALATLATIIASQSIITGAFSMTRQAIRLGWCPRLPITQTSADGYGQIYIGTINWLLMLVTIGLTIGFGSSDHLAAAYGIAVSLTMLLTTTLMFTAMREIWRWNLALSLIVAGSFFCIDVVFFSANFVKILEGAWIPLFLAVLIYILMITWRRGFIAVSKKMRHLSIPINQFINRLVQLNIPRVPGTAVFLSKMTELTPAVLVWHVALNKSLHTQVVALTDVTDQVPWVNSSDRTSVELLGPNFWRVIVRYGFMEKPDIPSALQQAQLLAPDLALSDVTYYVGRATILHASEGQRIPLWQEKIYAFMLRNAAHIAEYLGLPRKAVVELGRQIEI